MVAALPGTRFKGHNHLTTNCMQSITCGGKMRQAWGLKGQCKTKLHATRPSMVIFSYAFGP
eukprot:637751-Pelagomonas_calceolata.AAC.7